MKLTQFDRDMFSNEIHNILQGFGTQVTFIVPKEDEDSEYNEILQEFIGNVPFDEYVFNAMRYDYQSDKIEVDHMDSRKYGDREMQFYVIRFQEKIVKNKNLYLTLRWILF